MPYAAERRAPVLGASLADLTGQAVTPCTILESDPRQPYNRDGSRVTFLTREAEQGDLTGDMIANKLVLQSYDFCTGATTAIGDVEEPPSSDISNPGDRFDRHPAGQPGFFKARDAQASMSCP